MKSTKLVAPKKNEKKNPGNQDSLSRFSPPEIYATPKTLAFEGDLAAGLWFNPLEDGLMIRSSNSSRLLVILGSTLNS